MTRWTGEWADGGLDRPDAVGWWHLLLEGPISAHNGGGPGVQRTVVLVYVWSCRPLAIKRDGEYPRPGDRLVGWRKAAESIGKWATANLMHGSSGTAPKEPMP